MNTLQEDVRMAASRKQEERALSADERSLVDKTRHPAIQELSDQELSDLVRLLRERRDKARSLARQRRREMRGKSEPRGATASAADQGSWTKAETLASALCRLTSEASRRKRMESRLALAQSAQKALQMKQAAERFDASQINTRRAHDGMRAIARTKRQSLVRPMERGRLRKAASVAQATRDAR